MKIAVYLDAYRPEDGGGFTIQEDIFGALCDLESDLKQNIAVIASPRSDIKQVAISSGLNWIAYIGESFMDKVLAFVVRTFPSLRGKIRHRSNFERVARAAGVEFLWFLSPRPMDVDLPYMATVWDLQHRKQPWFPEVSEHSEWETRERRLEPFLRRAAYVVTGTQAGKNEVSEFFQIPAARIRSLAHPTPQHALEVSEALPVPAGLKPGYLFYPAQFWAHKNHVNLLMALKQLRERGIVIPLVLTGADFGNKKHVEGTIDILGLQDQVKILGFVDRKTLTSLYQNALTLTYVSFFGPENLPPLEAFALNCPVIASRVDGAEEQFADAAILVDPASVDEIASAIEKVYSDKTIREELAKRGKKRASEWTSIDFVRQALSIIEEFEPIRRTWES